MSRGILLLPALLLPVLPLGTASLRDGVLLAADMAGISGAVWEGERHASESAWRTGNGIYQGETGFPRSCKIMENHGKWKNKIQARKSHENLEKSHGKVMEFWFFTISFTFLLRKMCFLHTLLTHNDTDTPPSILHVKSEKLPDTRWVRVCFIKWV